jgi:transcription antitermination factor NusG
MSFVEGNGEPAGGRARLDWFAVQVRARYENVAATCVAGKGYECFLPTFWCRRRWSDRVKDMELPLFPGYFFCKFHPQDRMPILKTPAVVSIVAIAQKPIPVDEVEIEAVRTLVRSGLRHQPWPYVNVGERVRIEYGALQGLEGILQSFKGRHRIVVSVTLLQRSVAAEIDAAWVTPTTLTRQRIPLSSPEHSTDHEVRNNASGPLISTNCEA